MGIERRYKDFFIDQQFDKKLNISTQGYIKLEDQICYNNYEATPYRMLDMLFSEENFNANDYLVDVGSGLGRILFYASYRGCPTVLGIEKDKKIFGKMTENLIKYAENMCVGNIKITNDYIENIDLDKMMNKFFLFNPFDVTIFKTLMEKLYISLEEDFRIVKLYLYYPTKEYIKYLEGSNIFQFDKIIGSDLNKKNIYIYTSNKFD